jgi:signal transduction histidine kinase
MPKLEDSRLFSTLEQSDLRLLSAHSQARDFAPGEHIFSEGDPGDGIFVVQDGVVQISALVTSSERRVLGKIGAGDFFGEMAVLDGEPRSACAIAETSVQTLFIPRDKLLEVFDRSPRLAASLLREFSRRLREFNQRYVQEVLQAERLAVVGRFARTIVHDIKNPLHIIGLAAEIMDMESAPETMRKSATLRIRKQVERLSTMISELLEFTKNPDRGAVRSAHNFASYINSTVAELRGDIEERGVKITFRTPPPDVMVPLDPKRMLHVVTNLLHNAVEAMQGRGEIILSFEVRPNEVITEVIDTGPGIAPEIAARLFEAFATYGKAKGSGLGLSICRKIVEDHGGWIRARNQPGGGAVFSFALPAQP